MPKPELDTTETTDPSVGAATGAESAEQTTAASDASRNSAPPPSPGAEISTEKAKKPWDADLMARAREHGYTAAEAKAHGTQGNLRKALDTLERIAATRANGHAAKADAVIPTAAVAKDDIDITDKFVEEYGPELAAMLKKMKAHYDGKVAAMEREVSAVRFHVMQRAAEEFRERFNGYVTQLGDPEIFGEGAVESLDPDSPELKNRVAVAEEMDTILQGYLARNKPKPSEQQLFERSVASLFPDRETQKKRQELSSKIKGAGRQAIGPGRSRSMEDHDQRTSMTDVQRAKKAFKEKYAELVARKSSA